MKRLRRFKVALLAVALAVSSLGFSGCGNAGTVLTTPGNPVPVADLFPNALLAEPIQLRAGFTHLTQPFEIKGPEQTWNVEVGFVRNDQANPDGYIFCLTTSRLDNSARKYSRCKNDERGLNLHWELLRSDGTVVGSYSFDALTQQIDGSVSSRNSRSITLSGFRNQAAGQYRLRVTVLRDFPELDFAKPHLLVNKPFFRKLP